MTKREVPDGQETFALDLPAPRVRPKRATTVKSVTYKRIHLSPPPKCWRCVQKMRKDGTWVAPGSAAYSRTEEGATSYLCELSVQDARLEDGLKPLK